MIDTIKSLFSKLFGGVTASTIVRTLCFFLALINQILSATGHSPLPIENEQIESLVTVGLTVITGLIAWWKNNSFTSAAIAGDATMNELKGN